MCASKRNCTEQSGYLQVISTWTGIPLERLSRSEAQTLTSLPDILSKAVIGQDAAVDAVSKAVQRARSGMKDPARPQATLLFAGPSGVGKTSLALTLADQLFCAKVLSTLLGVILCIPYSRTMFDYRLVYTEYMYTLCKTNATLLYVVVCVETQYRTYILPTNPLQAKLQNSIVE